MHPELPFLAAGGIAMAGGAIRDKAWPDEWPQVLIGTVVLVALSSATAGTRVAPLVRAIGLLLVLAASIAAIRAANPKMKASK